MSGWVTVGQLWKEGQFVYNPSVEDIQRWSKKGIQPKDFGSHSGFNFHAWLTTENGIIVDVSFMSTLAQVRYYLKDLVKLAGGWFLESQIIYFQTTNMCQ
ncbi:hypothetical protein [Erwinia psidii]|uniref:hypothetical protein n=1 Tax=Erwinia psidii TaxID=69224 RepID=UPI001F3955C7|nr:hypothetical protein [Erwinia psidii]